MIIFIIFSILYIFRYDEIDENILNKEWYKYRYQDGYYETIYIDKSAFNYKLPININESNKYDNCSKYYYSRKSGIIKLNCKSKIEIIDIKESEIILKIDGEKKHFFDSIEKSKNYEFSNYFKMSMNEYKKENSQVKDIIKISPEKLINLYKGNEYSKVIFIGNKCNSLECIILPSVLEKWITKNDNIYYINSNELTNKNLRDLNKINKKLQLNKDYYNSYYPKIIVYNKKIIDEYELKCSGFDCTMYYNK